MDKRNRGTRTLFLHHFSRWYRNPKPFLGIMLTALLCSFIVRPMAVFAVSVEEPMQIFEPFIFMVLDGGASLMAFGILILMICDAPFQYPGLGFLAIRSRRSACLAAQIFYALVVVALLALWLLVCTALFVSGNAFLANEWSIPVQILVNRSAADRAHVSIAIFQQVIQNLTPYGALAAVFGSLLTYWWVLALVVYGFNLRWKRQVGVFVAVAMHLWGLVVSFSTEHPAVQFTSLWHHAAMSRYRFQGGFPFSPWVSCLYMLALGGLLVLFIGLTWRQEIGTVLSETSSRFRRN